MKKTYQKPQILFEDFSLCVNIAAGCEFKANHAENACGYQMSDFGVSIFTDRSFCTQVENDGYNTICYHIPTQLSNVFNS